MAKYSAIATNAFSAGQETYIRHRFAGRLNLDLNAALKRIVLILKDDRRLAAAEQLRRKVSRKFSSMSLNWPRENPSFISLVTSFIMPKKLFLGFLNIAALPGQEFITGVYALKFLDSADIRRAEGGYLAARIAYSRATPSEDFQPAGAAATRRMAQLIIIPKLIEDALFLKV